MQLKGYEVWIICDGNRLPEFGIQAEGSDGKTLVCYVPSESGKTFAVKWQDHVNLNHLRFATSIDGKEVGGSRCPPGGKGMRWGLRTGPTQRQQFVFSNLQTTDDDETLGMGMSSLEHLGEIEVAVSRIRAEYRSKPNTWSDFQPVGAVHERSKKAGVHCVSLGAACHVMHPTQTSSTPLHRSEGYVARFIFRYRPAALLQAQGIIPTDVKLDIAETENDAFRHQRSTEKRPRASDDDDVKPDVSDLDVDGNEDLDVLKNRLQRLQDTVDRAIKKRKSEASVSVASELTKADPGPSSRRLPSKPTIIDLTLSDSE